MGPELCDWASSPGHKAVGLDYLGLDKFANAKGRPLLGLGD